MSTPTPPKAASANVRGWLTHAARRREAVKAAEEALAAAQTHLAKAEASVQTWIDKVDECAQGQVDFLMAFEKLSARVSAVDNLPRVMPDDTQAVYEFKSGSGWKRPMPIPPCAGCHKEIKFVSRVDVYAGMEEGEWDGEPTHFGLPVYSTGIERDTYWRLELAVWWRERTWHVDCLKAAVMDSHPGAPPAAISKPEMVEPIP